MTLRVSSHPVTFVAGSALALRPARRSHKHVWSCSYLPAELLDVRYDVPSRSGSFGRVFFGSCVASDGSDVPIVVKCPIDTSLARQLHNMETYTNRKLQRAANGSPKRFPEYLGEVIVPKDAIMAPGLLRIGLVWRLEGLGDTMEDVFTADRLAELASALGTTVAASPLRRELASAVLIELLFLVQDLQDSGIVHRDIKPENILLVPQDPDGLPLKVIDLGSSCDWKSPLKKGLRMATCDPVYTAPEQRLDLFKPAYKFDIYSVALIALRCALPSLTSRDTMRTFVDNNLKQANFSLQQVCSGITAGRLHASQALRDDIHALDSSANEDLLSLLATMLSGSPADRADVKDCLGSVFLRGKVQARLQSMR